MSTIRLTSHQVLCKEIEDWFILISFVFLELYYVIYNFFHLQIGETHMDKIPQKFSWKPFTWMKISIQNLCIYY